MRAAEGPGLTRPGASLASLFNTLDERLSGNLPMVIDAPPPPAADAVGYRDTCKIGFLVTTQLESAVSCGSIMGCSPTMARMLDLTPQDVVGRSLFGLLADHWSKIVNDGECGKFVCRDPFRLISNPAGRVVLQGDNTHVAFVYRRDAFECGPLELIVWSFAEIDTVAFTDDSDERSAYDSAIVAKMSPFVTINEEIYVPENDAQHDNLALNSWAILQVWKYFRCNFSQVCAGYFQFFALENFDLIALIRKMDDYLRFEIAATMQRLQMSPHVEEQLEAPLAATVVEQAHLRDSLDVMFKNFLDHNTEFQKVLLMTFQPWGPEIGAALSAPKSVQGVPLDPIAKYLGDNLYLADSLPRHGDRMYSEIQEMLKCYGTSNEDYWVMRTRNFKMSDVFAETTKEVGESFGIVVADSFLVFRLRQYERARLMFQLAALHLDGDVSQDGIQYVFCN